MAQDICTACGQEEPTKKGSKKGNGKKDQPIDWICCDRCLKWFHAVCIRATNLPLQEITNYWYFCQKCTIIGTLIPKHTPPTTAPASKELTKIDETITDLSEKLRRLQVDLEASQSTWRKQLDKLRNQVLSSGQLHNRQLAQRDLVNCLETKLEVIESGAKLASTCLQGVNKYRIAINKIPYRAGENVKNIVKGVLGFLGIAEPEASVTDCFRIPVKPSKWSDRSISPTIIVIFSQKEAKEEVLKLYFENYRKAKLSSLQSGPALEYRFTLNEVLSIQSFRIRNLALRLKQQKLVESFFVRNDSVSVRLPGQKKYVPISDSNQLLQLTAKEVCKLSSADESSIFFDAESSIIPGQTQNNQDHGDQQ